jgi:hypothetical protein
MSNNIKKRSFQLIDGRYVVDISDTLVENGTYSPWKVMMLSSVDLLFKGIRPPKNRGLFDQPKYKLPEGLAKWLKQNCKHEYSFRPHMPYYDKEALVLFEDAREAMMFKLTLSAWL